MKQAIINRPWVLIIGGYLFAMVAWIAMVSIAIKHRDPEVPVTTALHP